MRQISIRETNRALFANNALRHSRLLAYMQSTHLEQRHVAAPPVAQVLVGGVGPRGGDGEVLRGQRGARACAREGLGRLSRGLEGRAPNTLFDALPWVCKLEEEVPSGRARTEGGTE